MRALRVAVLGATGAVGREMIKMIEARAFPVRCLRCLASAKSAGTTLPFLDENITVQEATDASFREIDLVFGAASADVSRRFLPAIRNAGAVFIDNSSAFRLEADVPLVIPEINPEDARAHRGVLANPNCSTIIALIAVAQIRRLSPIVRMVAATYQAVSGAGAGGTAELLAQIEAIRLGETPVASAFPHPIAYNLIPHIGNFLGSGDTTEEMKMQQEGRKILHLPELLVDCTCVRVPIPRAHTVALTLETESFLSLEQIRAALAAAPGVQLRDDPKANVYPMPISVSHGDIVEVGRLRRSRALSSGVSLLCCGDQLRKGAATNAVQIAELL